MKVWQQIPGWSAYEVSSYGHIRRDGHVLKRVPVLSGSRKTNYRALHVSLSNGPKIKSIKVAFLVLLTFRVPPKPGQIIRHLDDNQQNNRLSNLHWGTPKQNGEDRARNGKTKRGETNGNSHLTKEAILYIKKHYKRYSKEFNLAYFATKFNVSISAVSNITTNKTWQHL